MPRLALHPACKIFPPLPPDELQALADDIAANGLRNPIVLHQGKILDGRNRYEACRIAGVEPDFTDFDGDDPIGWVVSQNVVRRHLTASQRAVVALDLLPLLEKEAKERQRESNSFRQNGRLAQDCANRENGKSAEMAARIAKASARYVEAVKSIRQKAPELIERIRAGEINVPDAEKLAEVPVARRRSLLEQANGNGNVFASWRRESKQVVENLPFQRTAKERARRVRATEVISADCRVALPKIRSASVDLVLCDPPYPEVSRQYGRLSETAWHELMHEVVHESRRVLTPAGSAVFILQPNYKRVGEMRLWLWEFMIWAAREWNLVQDVMWWCVDTLPAAGTQRNHGLLRQSVKTCVWLGRLNATAIREPCSGQSRIARQPESGVTGRQNRSGGHTVRDGRTAEATAQRGGSTPFNLLPIAHSSPRLNGDHPATTPYDLAAWWCRYLLPPGGVLLDAFCGSGTMLQAALDCGASKVIGIDKERKYVEMARKRIREG